MSTGQLRARVQTEAPAVQKVNAENIKRIAEPMRKPA